MNTRSLRTFRQIASAGSFAAAARQLNMTLAAVSMQMKVLEEELRISLFDRSFRPPRLTVDGRALLPHAEAVLAAEDALRHHCTPDDLLRGQFRLGFVGTASVRLLPGFLKAASREAADAGFSIETGISAQLERRLINGQIDAAVISASSKRPAALRYATLAEESLQLAVPTECAGDSVEALFRALPFLQFSPHSGVGQQIARHVTRLSAYDAKRAILLDSVEAIMECVKEGIGFTLLPLPDIERYADERVRVRDGGKPTPVRRLVLATLASSPQRTADLLAGLFRAGPPA